MEPFTIVLAFFLVTASGTLTWWLATMDASVQSLQDDLREDRLSQANDVDWLRSKVDELHSGVSALLHANPELASIIDTHRALDKIEASLAGDLLSADPSDAATTLLAAVRDLLSTVDVDGDLDTARSELDLGTLRLADRLQEVFVEVGLRPSDLGLSDLEARRLGELAYRNGHRSWALACFEEAARIAPGEKTTLRALEHLASEAGDDEARRSWLEAQLKRDPDNPELLRSHANLLAIEGDAGAERSVRRLEALGVDTPADRSLLSGLRERAGARSEALESLDKALEEDPENSGYWLRKATLHFEMEDESEAIKAVDKCLSFDRQNGEAWALHAHLLSTNSRELTTALKSAVHAVALVAGGTELILLKADLLAATGKEVDAQESLEKSLNNNPNNDVLRAAMARMALQKGEIDEAESLLRTAPTPPTMSLHLQLEWGRLHLALADLKRDGTGDTDRALLTVAGDNFRHALDVDRESGIAWLGMARVHRLMKELEIAEESLNRSRRLMEDDPAIEAEAALLALDQGDLTEAERLVQSSSVNDPDNPVIPYIKGNIAAAHGRFEEAKEFYTDALLKQPTHVRARINRASVNMALEEPQGALDDCHHLLCEAPELHLAVVRRSEALMMLAQWSEAKEGWEKVLDFNPNHSHALMQLAACHMALERPELAETPLNDALRIDSSNAAAWHQRGLLYLEWGREEAALADFEKAAKADEKHLDARLHIAAIHHEANRWNEGRDAWRDALSIDPENTVARRRFEESDLKIVAEEALKNA
jgi:tetratricopeptide (TPR) repeat protein